MIDAFSNGPSVESYNDSISDKKYTKRWATPRVESLRWSGDLILKQTEVTPQSSQLSISLYFSNYRFKTMELPPEDANEGNDPQEDEEEAQVAGVVGRGLSDDEKSIIFQEILQLTTGEKDDVGFPILLPGALQGVAAQEINGCLVSRQTVGRTWAAARANFLETGVISAVSKRKGNSGRKKKDRTDQLHAMTQVSQANRDTFWSTAAAAGIPLSTLWRMLRSGP